MAFPATILRSSLMLFACLSSSVLALDAAAEADAKRKALMFFENEIRPVLANRCYSCHGEEKQKGSLRLDNISHIMAGGEAGPVLVVGKPDESLMIEAIRYKNTELQMPPKEQLPENEVALLAKWVAMGAPWPQSEVAAAGAKTVDQYGFTKEERDQWCFQPLANPTPPALPGNQWVRNEIDRFVAQKHQEMKLDAAPEASPHELVRRVYFDLTGLPPTPKQLEEFVSKPDEESYEKLVDSLLASPAYGERWAQHWLDLVRFAESDGYNADAYRPSAWPYRDWVIKAFNSDMPYNEFVRQQLAGDEIAPEDPNVLIATSYLRNGIYEWNQRDVRGQRQLIIEDMTDTSGELFLGLSFGCARCHNHKFDPILQADYYRLQAFFSPVVWRTDMKLATKDEQTKFNEQQAIWENATVEIRAKMDAMVGSFLEKRMKQAHERFRDDIEVMMDKDPKDREPLEHQLASIAERQVIYEKERFDPLSVLKKEEDKKAYQALDAELKTFDHLKPKPLMDAFVATDAMAKAPATVLKTRKGEREIAPGFLTILDPSEPDIKPIGNSTGRRTALANWITRPDNQLATRAIVNRVWNYHFGRGLSGVPSDLGNLGEKPTHPELLDWLARRFVAEGWSFKKLHKVILLSSTYRQTALRKASSNIDQIDPGNKFLWRFNPRRLDAEQARDAMLVASGELDRTVGGVAKNSTRRAIYITKKRNNQDEFLRSLDAPAGFISTSERQSTTTPTQALYMINGDWTLARARKLASRSNSIDDAWKYTLGREPTPKEAELAEKFLTKRVGNLRPALTEQKSAGADSIFHEGTPHERLIAKKAKKEGDEFTVEAIVTVNSVDAGAAVRTIASRWNVGKDNIEAFGWSLGVTGEKSRFKPGNLIVQLVGEDENANIAYDIAASDIRLALKTPYHVVAKISCAQKTVTFRVQDLNQPSAPAQSAVIPHDIRRNLGGGNSSLVIGGLSPRLAPHQWDGRIEAARVVSGTLTDKDISSNPSQWKNGNVLWDANRELTPGLEWTGYDGRSDSSDPWQNALTDLCHVLLNSNEFIYLH